MGYKNHARCPLEAFHLAQPASTPRSPAGASPHGGGYVPDRATFRSLAAEGNLIPVYKEVIADCDTPVSALKKLGTSRYAYLLESVEGGERLGRYSFVGASASMVFRSYGRSVEIETAAGIHRRDVDDPLAELERLMAQYRPVFVPGLPRFYGGAVGYLGYDMVRHFETLPDQNADGLGLPDSYFLITDTVLIFDHARRKLQILVNAHVDGEPDAAYDEAIATIDRTLALLHEDSGPGPLAVLGDAPQELPQLQSNMTPQEYTQAVEQAKEYIKAGDIFQVVLSQRFSLPVQGDPFNIYRVLRTVNPSPYMFYLKLDELSVVGSSPEVMVRAEEGEAMLRPIAGTRPRGRDDESDRALAAELLADAKERAEHIMLVDLGRNDLGRVCEYGSVAVDELMVIERYSHVMHIVSNVHGRLAPDKNAFDLLRAAFPAGTLSGAPKIRAMQIIDELEKTRRGPYGGAVTYVGFSGNMDSCITIRTVIIHDGLAHVQAGAGIVADSDPEREYEETVNKARGVLGAIVMAEQESGWATAR